MAIPHGPHMRGIVGMQHLDPAKAAHFVVRQAGQLRQARPDFLDRAVRRRGPGHLRAERDRPAIMIPAFSNCGGQQVLIGLRILHCAEIAPVAVCQDVTAHLHAAPMADIGRKRDGHHQGLRLALCASGHQRTAVRRIQQSTPADTNGIDERAFGRPRNGPPSDQASPPIRHPSYYKRREGIEQSGGQHAAGQWRHIHAGMVLPSQAQPLQKPAVNEPVHRLLPPSKFLPGTGI